jgi:transcriptional regulator GlxA family with amidase domain
MLTNVVAIVDECIHPFELGVACEVFGIDRSDDGLPVFDFAVCGTTDGPLQGAGGFTLQPAFGLRRAEAADLIIIPAWRVGGGPADPALIRTLQRAVDRGAMVLSECTGAFLLAEAGLLDGRRATTHWNHVQAMQERYPHITIEPDRLYVQDGPVITSAGTAAGIDACLAVVRRELGVRVANGIARRMVVPPHRDGGQAQFVETPVPLSPGEADDLSALLEWLLMHLGEAHTVESLADRANQSPRTFVRRFAASTGTTPHAWLQRQRVLLAQCLLEQPELGVEEIARKCGFGTADLLRHHFSRQVGTAPLAYRRAFRATPV